MVKELKRKFDIPVYNAELWIVVSPNPTQAREKLTRIFPMGDDESEDDVWSALCLDNKVGSFGLVFNSAEIDINIVAHEVYHLTHAVLNWVSVEHEGGGEEAGAYLNGYLTELVLKALKYGPGK